MSRVNNKINIKVDSVFIKDRSSLKNSLYVFSYHIQVFNKDDLEARLLSRYWKITDGNGHIEEIRGPGVVGLKPNIKPGEKFEYSSFCPLKTPFGVMHGYFKMVNRKVSFNAVIPPFRLSVPEEIN